MTTREAAVKEHQREVLKRTIEENQTLTLMRMLKKRRIMCKQAEHGPNHRRDLHAYHLTSTSSTPPIVSHAESPMTEWGRQTLSPNSWNKFRFTQIKPNPLATNEIGPWTCNRKARTLLQAASNVLAGDEGAVLAFHGTSTKYIRDIQGGLVLSGEGCMGTGLYVTLDPTEAMGYACMESSTAHEPIILELVIENANTVELGEEYPEIHDADYRDEKFEDEFVEQIFGDKCHASRDSHVAADIALHTRGCLRITKLVRIHMFKRTAIGVFPTYRLPGYRPTKTCSQFYDKEHPEDDVINYEPRKLAEWGRHSGIHEE